MTQGNVEDTSRRRFLTTCAAGGIGISSVPDSVPGGETSPSTPARIRFCLNTSTIRGQKLPLVEEVDLVAAAGYDGIEPWIREIEAYRDAGGSLPDLRKQIEDRGLRVESAIGFARWIVDDDHERQQGLEQLKRDMELLRAIGGTRIAAPPVGMHTPQAPRVDLLAAAERYRAALEVGRELGVVPQLEVWGFSRNLSRLGESVFVAVESDHPDACLLLDVYHIYKGGSGFGGMKMLSGKALHCFHVNDYPADPPRTDINDAKRVYPGEGIAPWQKIIAILQEIGFTGAVSLELFNETYWKQDPRIVLETGLRKMKTVFSAT